MRSRLRFPLTMAMAMALSAVVTPVPASAGHGTNDTYYAGQYALHRIRGPHAWHISTGQNVPIAIIDTGVNYTHPDLAANMHPARFDFFSNDGDPWDANGHGTMVAGLAAAVANNGRGVAGTAPGAKIMAVRVGGQSAQDKTVSGSAVTQAMMWAADRGAKVINLSLGANLPVAPVPDWDVAALYAFAKGAVIVAAAGNSASPYCGTPAFDPFVICVGATNELDHRASFSNYGVGLDVVAPGVRTMTTLSNHGYGAPSGTSMASPVVAGMAAQLVSMGASNVLVPHILRRTAVDLGTPGWDPTYGWGRVDAYAAVLLCSDVCSP
jgi:subtilisin family serine protease